MASKYQAEHDYYLAQGNADRAAQVVAAAKAEGDPVADPATAADDPEAVEAPVKAKRARKA